MYSPAGRLAFIAYEPTYLLKIVSYFTGDLDFINSSTAPTSSTHIDILNIRLRALECVHNLSTDARALTVLGSASVWPMLRAALCNVVGGGDGGAELIALAVNTLQNTSRSPLLRVDLRVDDELLARLFELVAGDDLLCQVNMMTAYIYILSSF